MSHGYLHIYSNSDYDGLRCSPEVIAAFEEVGGDDILDDDSVAHRIWAGDGTNEQDLQVELLAWSMHRDGEDVPLWCDMPIRSKAELLAKVSI